MALLPPVVLELKANATELRAGMAEVGGELDKLEKHSASTGEKVKAALSKGFEIGGAAVTGIAAGLEHLSQPIEQAKKQMEVAFTDAGSSADEYKEQIGKAEAAMRNFGHSQSDTDQALQKLTQGLQDPKKALDDMGLVADLAAAKHMSLADAADKVVKITAGNTKVLKEFGIQAAKAGADTKALATDTKASEAADTAQSNAAQHLADVHALLAGKTKLTTSEQITLRKAEDAVFETTNKAKDAHDKLAKAQDAVSSSSGKTVDNLDMLSQRIHGQAAAAVDTFGGRIDVLKVKLEDWVGVHAQKLIPILTATGPALMGVGAIIQSGVVPAIGKAVLAMGEMIVKTAVWVATTVADAAVAVAAWVVDMAVMAASAIAAGAAMLLPFLPVILILAAVGVAAYELYTHWDAVFGFIKSIVSDAFDWVKKHLDLIIEVAFGPLGIAIVLLKDHWRDLWDGIKAAVSSVWDFIRPIFENIQRAVGDVVGAIGKVTSLESSTIGKVGHLLGFADGGVVPGPMGAPMLAVVHGGETVIPPGGIVTGGGASSSASGLGGDVHIHLPGGVIVDRSTVDRLAAQILDALNRSNRRGVNMTTALGLS